MGRFETIPVEIAQHILSFLTPKEAVVSGLASSFFYQQATDDQLWEKYVERDFPNERKVDNIGEDCSHSTPSQDSQINIYKRIFHKVKKIEALDNWILSFNSPYTE